MITLEDVADVISKQFGFPVLPDPGLTLAELSLDSLDLIEFSLACEARWPGLPQEATEDLTTLSSLADIRETINGYLSDS